eukprot:1754599-Amphidinium_carterae.2
MSAIARRKQCSNATSGFAQAAWAKRDPALISRHCPCASLSDLSSGWNTPMVSRRHPQDTKETAT